MMLSKPVSQDLGIVLEPVTSILYGFLFEDVF